MDPYVYNQRLKAASQQIEIPQGYLYGTDYNTLHMMPNPGYQGTWDFNPQMGQQVPRNPNPQADKVAAEGDRDDEKSVQSEAKRADLFVQTPISRVV